MGAIFAAAGSAVGLGNIWRFPMLVGDNGGAAFILIYIMCILLVGIPIMVGEFVIGLGVLFIGMEYMADSMDVVFAEVPALQNLFASELNPFI